MYKCRRMGERHGIGWPLHLLPGGGRRGTLSQSRCGFDLDDGRRQEEVDNRKKKNRGGCGIPVGEAGPLFLVGVWVWVRVLQQQLERCVLCVCVPA